MTLVYPSQAQAQQRPRHQTTRRLDSRTLAELHHLLARRPLSREEDLARLPPWRDQVHEQQMQLPHSAWVCPSRILLEIQRDPARVRHGSNLPI